MTRLTGITPRPNQVRTAHTEEFDSALQLAGGRDGRITRASAERLAQREDAGSLVADNILSFLNATGQQSVSVRRMQEVLGNYVERHAEQEAGPNQRLSLVEIRNLPGDLQADVLHLRGRSDLPSAPDLVKFNENDLYAYEPWSKPVLFEANTGTISHDGTKAVLTGGPDFGEYQDVVLQALNDAWDGTLQHQVWGNHNTFELGQAGTVRVSPIINGDTLKEGLLVHWNDLDDASFACFYEKTRKGYVKRNQVHLG